MSLPGIIVDVSSNNGDPSSWNFPAMRAAGVIAVLAKATQGTGYTNPYFAKTRQLARNAGLDFAGYHFADFNAAPATQASYFRSVAGADAKILDSETNMSASWQDAFLADLNNNPSQEMDYGSASTLPRSGVRGLLWIAAYGPNNPGGAVWQYTDAKSVNGCPVQLDASIWNGTATQYDDFFGRAIPGTGQVTLDFPNSIDATATADGLGDWVVGTDGGVFCVGTAQYYGSLPGMKVSVSNIKRITRSWGGKGYYLLGADGGVYAFGDAALPPAPFSYPGLPAAARLGNRTFGAFVLHWGGTGYTLIALDGARYSFGK